MKKRITVIILALCTALTSFFTPRVLSAQALSAPEIEILYDGETVNDLLISQTQKYEITALCNPESDGCGYRWQICADTKASLWVDIYGANERSLKVSYPMISSLLDDAGSVYLRCAVTLSGEAYFSGPINITVAFDAKEADPPAEAENVAKEIPETPAAVYSLKAARVALLSEEETEYVYITINYRDSVSGEAIYSPYTAKIEKGTAFNQTVISPTFLGYAPHYKDSEGNKGEACPSVVFNETNLDTDITKDVFYYPIEVPYAIRYFFQNINDDLYTERAELYHTDKALTGTIISNEKLESHAGDTTGFSKLYHYPESVAADGSTVFECYYDRNYYLLKFDTDGGYGSEPIYARYGTPFIVNDPVKPGYVFKGWDLLDEDGKGDGVTDTLPSTIPAANQSYKALWESITTDVTVVYWLQDPNNADKYNYWGSYTTTAQSGTEIQATDYKDYSINTALNNSLNIYEKRYSTFNEEKTNAMVFVQGDGSTVVNVYYDRKEYTLKFYYAMSSGSGTNTKYYVIGGTTYYFGAYTNNGDEIALLDQYMSTYSDQRGQVTLLPALNERGNGRSYTQSYDTSTVSGTAYNYYYISFKAKYGADITNLWPCDVFGSVERSTANTHGKWTGTTAYVSAWNGEHHVYYSLHNSNQTIKGNYNTLDYNLLWDYNSYGDSDTVAYLCFWENGANIGWSVPKLFRYNIYLPRLDGTGYDLSVSYDTFDDSNVYSQTPPAISGFTFDNYTYSEITGYDKNKYNGAYDMNFYYTRNPYTLNFYNYNKYIDEKKETVYFETPLGSKFFIPDYPDKLEENAYEFVGWYTSPGCYDGTEFGDINGFGDNTMPAHDLTLYAKWVPKTHTVRFFQTYQDKLNYEKNGDTSGIIETKVISHGNTVGAIDNPTDKSGYDYTFGGWFYEKNSEKIAFTPLDTPVKEDVNVFADWGSHTAQPYLLHYVLKTAETEDVWKTAAYEAAGGSPAEQKRYEVTVGTETRGYVYYEGGWHLCVADDTTGYAYAGSTRTFTAKAGDPLNQLYSAYNSGYFPTLASHSITVQFENNAAQPEKNVFTFTYVYATNVSYTVKYLDKNTGLPLKADEHKTTDYSVVTERFAVIENYVPDAFYKRLVISVKEDPENPGNYVGSEDNVIIFYYTQNETAAFYAVHFMLRKLGATGDNYAIDGSGDYYESDSHIEGIANKDTTVNITPLTFDGFTVVVTKAIRKISGLESETSANPDGSFDLTIDKSGSELYIFYTRNAYNFTVRYLRYNTNEPLHDDLILKNWEYGSTVTANAIDIGGMTCVSPLTQSAAVRSNEVQNVIIFYYSDLQYTVEYKVWDNGGGTLSSTIEVKEGTDDFIGSTAAADAGYKFDGWYLDPECTVSADSKATVTDNKLVPITAELSPMPTVNTFYAKFTRLYGTLTIKRDNAADEGGGTQTFIYRITDKNDPANVFYATVTGNNSKTVTNVPCGNYTVEQLNVWSWRYSDSSQEVSVDTGGKTVTFNKAADKEYWLSGSAESKINKRSGG